MLNEDSITELKQSLRGRLIQPGDADYDEARKVYNGMIHKKPRLIARCADVADVIRSVNFARDNDLLVSIRGGGHNWCQPTLRNSGLLVDLSEPVPAGHRVVDDDFVVLFNAHHDSVPFRLPTKTLAPHGDGHWQAIVDTVRAVLEESGIAPRRLCLEITETTLMSRAQSALDTLHALKALGVSLADVNAMNAPSGDHAG